MGSIGRNDMEAHVHLELIEYTYGVEISGQQCLTVSR